MRLQANKWKARVKDEAAQTYVNVLVVKEGNENEEGIRALAGGRSD